VYFCIYDELLKLRSVIIELLLSNYFCSTDEYYSSLS